MTQEFYKKQFDEAVKRMRLLGLDLQTVDAFKKGKVWQSEYIGLLYELDEEAQKAVKKVTDNGGLVYHVVKTTCDFGDGCPQNHYSVLYVSKYEEEWEADVEDMKQGYVYTYVYNSTIPEFSEYGSIFVESSCGGLVRKG